MSVEEEEKRVTFKAMLLAIPREFVEMSKQSTQTEQNKYMLIASLYKAAVMKGRQFSCSSPITAYLRLANIS